ncbi:hypothetical protein OUZ56_033811 [Daphnia magna]|uniref:Uncharacterized protein n=1 Tax=Daphnia magna TaxID=35525 RepID=A0ABR0BB45_9CRUS|nr:hypothetical protein OUZ56_033811 [Daphnia magna]
MLIEKSVLATMAIEETKRAYAYMRRTARLTFQATRNDWGKIDKTASAQTSEFQQSLEDMKQQLAPRQPGSNPKARDHNLSQPEAFRRASVYCDFQQPLWDPHSRKLVQQSINENKGTTHAPPAEKWGITTASSAPPLKNPETPTTL